MLNNLTWVDSKFVLDMQKNKSAFQITLNEFFNRFKTPLEWLNSKEKSVKVNNSNSEFGYILYWICQSNIWQIEEYKTVLMDYILSEPFNHSLSNIPKALGLLSDDEIKKIKSIDKGIAINKIGALCILLNKTLKDFTDSDIDSFISYDGFFNKVNFSRKRLYSLRVSLSYSNVIVTRKPRKTNWDKLYCHEKYGSIFREYRKILVASNAKNDYLQSSANALFKLLSFMEIEGIDSFENFNANTFESLVDYVSSNTSPSATIITIPKIKHFFLVNIGQDMFPKELLFCDTFWTGFSRKVKKIYKETDGRAFSDIELPKKIVNILINFEPTNEIELLCKEFWLIISSCPVRFSYLLTLNAENALQRMPNNPNAYGLYSEFRDKAGNKYGQFPILDKIGLNAVKRLQERTKKLNFKPIFNTKFKTEFIHLFQLSSSPWVLNKSAIERFYSNVIMSKIRADYPDDAELRATAHSFRHYLITHVAMKTGDETACQTAAGHLDVKMTHTYLRSKASKDSLLLRVLDKYDKKEITGKFYLKLVELLTSQDSEVDHILYSVSTEMKVDAFFEKYGKKTHLGYCFNKEDCSKWNACWGCNNFIMTRNEITEAIKILSHQIIALKNLTLCADFSYEVPSVKNKLKLISLIIKRLTELGLSEENINKMTENCFKNIDIMTGVEQ